ncbi:hypothetical protein MMC25_007519 [Agyrium rufum]|nr:hypothetical protein [Agyrium rufum]
MSLRFFPPLPLGTSKCTRVGHGLAPDRGWSWPSHRSFSVTTPTPKTKDAKKQKHVSRYEDPYVQRQARAKRMAILSRQQMIRAEHAAALGTPIRGVSTPFVQSLDTGVSPTSITSPEADSSAPPNLAPISSTDLPPLTDPHLAHQISEAALEESIAYSQRLTAPIPSANRALRDPAKEREEKAQHGHAHATASEALRRISSLPNLSSKSRLHTNISRVVATFGRHNTDNFLRQKAPSTAQLDLESKGGAKAPTPRAGPDTGSSEVQIGILTAKIRVLADRFEEKGGNGDKVNKRNLRLLLHRRQKLMRYMFKSERGSGRWERMVGLLGLTDACWKGEIEVR